MAYVTLDNSGNITGIYNMPQPTLAGYEVISDTDSRIAVYNNRPPRPLQRAAQIALDKTDTTALRCFSAGVGLPTDFQTYRIALRAIVNGTDTTSTQLPTAPTDYPANT